MAVVAVAVAVAVAVVAVVVVEVDPLNSPGAFKIVIFAEHNFVLSFGFGAVAWRHGREQKSKSFYTHRVTGGYWRFIYSFVLPVISLLGPVVQVFQIE